VKPLLLAALLSCSCAHTRVVQVGDSCAVEAMTLLRSVSVACGDVVIQHPALSVTFANWLSALAGAAAAWVGGVW